MSVAPVLVLGVGNPSRGDDALGPALIERAQGLLAGEIARGEVELLTDFQLQPEHALDLAGRARVIFVDASVGAAAPFTFTRVAPREDRPFTTHAMSPEAVLAALEQALGGRAPEAWLLAIRGERFELGEGLGARARANLDAALSLLAHELSAPTASAGALRIHVGGTVQGVGFRPWVYRTATRLGLRGSVWNGPRGVTVEAFGPQDALQALVACLRDGAPEPARVRALRVEALGPREVEGFVIADSLGEAVGDAPLPADLAACDACLRETRDPGDRRYGYAFTSCASCGPRFALAWAIPFDRGSTSMAPFSMCSECAREHADPADRRFHAVTTSCPACGPSLWIADPEGRMLPSCDVIASAADRLRAGEVLGVQGVGAFHLVADATSADAVARLRRRKRRDAQPFALMVADLEGAARLALLDAPLIEALTSTARPIVLAPTRGGAPFEVAAVNGPSSRTAVMLPYTPLHQLLSEAFQRPLVVTSGNVHGGPAVTTHAGALASLRGVVDALVLHDRPIARRVEDSVVASGHGGVRVIRRSRGFAPTPLRLPAASPAPVLAAGAHAKAAACVVVGDQAFLTPHLGDLDSFEGERAWVEEVEGLERFLGVRAEVLAHDLHPDYASTRYALARGARRRVGVQHHVAHAMATLAEHRVEEPVIAVAFDGTGYGTDGTSWGGEVLLIDGGDWARVSSLRAIPLPGGERAIREVWRVALGALADTFGTSEALAISERIKVFDGVPRRAREAVLRMVERGVEAPPARGVGRYFDAVGAMALGLPRADFDGHVAAALEERLRGGAEGYPFDGPAALGPTAAFGGAHEIDLRPALRALVGDLLAEVPAPVVSARFHACLIDATARVVARALGETGLRRVVLCGGAMQNRALEQGLVARLGERRALLPREVPVNDGGIALGQAWAAVLALREDAG